MTLNMNEAGRRGDDIIGIGPARSGRGGVEEYEYDVECCKAESKKDDMTTDR